MRECCKYCTCWWCCGDCPNADIDLYMLASCEPWWWGCHLVLVMLGCPGREDNLVSLGILWWTVCWGPRSLDGWETCACSALQTSKVSLTNLSQILGWLHNDLRALVLKSSIKRLAMNGCRRDPKAAPFTHLLILTLKSKKGALRQNLRRDIMLGMESGVQYGSVVSCCSLLCMIEEGLYVISWHGFPLLYLDGFGLFYKVLGVSDMVGENTYQRLEDVYHFFSYSICHWTPTRQYGP